MTGAWPSLPTRCSGLTFRYLLVSYIRHSADAMVTPAWKSPIMAYKHCIRFDLLKELPWPMKILSSTVPGYAGFWKSDCTGMLLQWLMSWKEWLPYLISVTLNYKLVSNALVITTRVLLLTVWLYAHSNPGYEKCLNRGSSRNTKKILHCEEYSAVWSSN